MLGWIKKRGPLPPLLLSFILGIVVVLSITIFLPDRARIVAPLNPAARLFEFVLGMATCHWWLRERSTTPAMPAWTGFEFFALVISATLVVGLPALVHGLNVASPPAFWIGSEISALGFAALIWIFAHQTGAISRALSSRACEWFGEISFALYMCHQIILRWLDPKVMHDPWDAVIFFVPYLAASLLVAAAIFHGVETPVRHIIVSAYKRRRAPVGAI